MKIEVLEKREAALLLSVELTETWSRKFVVGQDRGSGPPFVAQVPLKIGSVNEAFEWMMPKEVKKAIEAFLSVKRQGDWFFVPCEAPKGPAYEPYDEKDRKRLGRPMLDPNVLYRDVYGGMLVPTRHTSSVPVVHRANNRPYVRGTVSAPDHPPLYLDGQWHRAIQRVHMVNGTEVNRGPRGDD